MCVQCKSKIGIGSGVRSSTESESEGSEEFLFLPIPLPLPSLPIQWEQGERNQNGKRNYQPIKKTHYQSLSNLEQEKNGGSRENTGRSCETVTRFLWQVLQGLQRQQQVELSVGRTKFSHKVPKFALTFPFQKYSTYPQPSPSLVPLQMSSSSYENKKQ